MKIIKTIVNSGELSSLIDLSVELSGLNKSAKREALNEIGEYLIEQTLSNIGESKSPVKGESIPALTSKIYKDYKRGEVGNTKANMELNGDMLDSVDFEIVDTGKIKIGVFGDSAPKADGHNNFSGDSRLPKRRIFPDEGQSYKSYIESEIKKIIADHKSKNINKSSFKDVESKSDLYSKLSEITGLSKRSEIRLAVLRNESLLESLIENGLEDYL